MTMTRLRATGARITEMSCRPTSSRPQEELAAPERAAVPYARQWCYFCDDPAVVWIANGIGGCGEHVDRVARLPRALS
jgi:hypothetical protein